MSPEQKALVKETWQQLGPKADAVTTQFYDRVFEVDPSLRELFQGTDLAAQRQKLIQAFSTVVSGLDHLEDLLPAVEDLGRRHVRYGVVDSHYDTVGEALLHTFERALGPSWSADAAGAWSAAYGALSGVMREAARKGAV